VEPGGILRATTKWEGEERGLQGDKGEPTVRWTVMALGLRLGDSYLQIIAKTMFYSPYFTLFPASTEFLPHGGFAP
jgi:hypothetical protein